MNFVQFGSYLLTSFKLLMTVTTHLNNNLD